MQGMDSPLVRSVTVNGRKYKINFSYDSILDMIYAMEDETMCEVDRADYCCWRIVIGHVRLSDRVAIINAVIEAIKGQSEGGEQAVDFKQDWSQIKAAFRQAYGIDLDDSIGKLHWLTFVDLLQNVPAQTRLAETIDIRLRPMPKATKYNAEERMELAKAKAKVRIKKKPKDFESGLYKFAMAMKEWAERS